MLSFVEVSCDVAAALFHIIAAVCLEVAENVFYISPPPPRPKEGDVGFRALNFFFRHQGVVICWPNSPMPFCSSLQEARGFPGTRFRV